MKKYHLIILSLLLTGCTNFSQVHQGTSLPEGKGLLLTKFTCNDFIKGASIYRTGTGFKKWGGVIDREGQMNCNKGYITTTLPAGDYYIGTFVGKAVKHPKEKDALKFSILQNKITYIGDVKSTTRFTHTVNDGAYPGPKHVSYHNLYINVVDETDLAKDYLEKNHQELAKEYEFTVHLAKQ